MVVGVRGLGGFTHSFFSLGVLIGVTRDLFSEREDEGRLDDGLDRVGDGEAAAAARCTFSEREDGGRLDAGLDAVGDGEAAAATRVIFSERALMADVGLVDGLDDVGAGLATSACPDTPWLLDADFEVADAAGFETDPFSFSTHLLKAGTAVSNLFVRFSQRTQDLKDLSRRSINIKPNPLSFWQIFFSLEPNVILLKINLEHCIFPAAFLKRSLQKRQKSFTS